jgi:hypothetical protein
VIANKTNNEINFTVNNVAVGGVNSGGLEIHAIAVDDIFLNNNIISTTVSNSDLELERDGTGELIIDEISFVSNTIKNNSIGYDGITTAGILVINSTNLGKVKFDGTAGLVVPSGGDSDRPANPPVGDTRWNTDSVILETWDGNQYIAAAGIAATIGSDEFDDLLLEYTLTLG